MSNAQQTTSTGARRQVSPSKEEVIAARALAKQSGLEYVDLDRYPLNTAATSLLPQQSSRRHHALAVGWKFGTPVVAVSRPDDAMAMDDLRTIIGRDVHAVVACESQIDAYIERVYARAAATDPVTAPTTRTVPLEAVSPPPAPASAKKAASTPKAPPDAPEPEAAVEPPAVDTPAESTEPEAAAESPEPEAAAETLPPASEVAADPVVEKSNDAVGEPLDVGTKETNGVDAATIDALLAENEAVVAAPAAGADENLSNGEWEPVTRTTPDLADLLVSSGQVTRDEIEAALREKAATGRPLGDILSELGLVSEEDLIRATAAESGLEFIDLNDEPIDPEASKLIPEALARRHRVLGLGYRDNTPVIGMANPSDVFAIDDLRTLLGSEMHIVVCSPGQIAEYLSRVYRHDRETTLAAQTAASQTSAGDETKITELADLHSVVEDAPIVKYVNLILRQALQERASDIHVEPSADDLRIRFRIDGVLHEVTRSPKAIQGGVTTRLKVMANMDIAEHRVPQDGRITLTAGRREVDLRVATLPTVHGEKIVLRVLDKSNASLNLSELGFLPNVEERYEVAYRKAYGTILVTGPTGSGKSTTLYATLNTLNVPERNLITVEDPVEYQLRGVTQVQVNPKAGLHFANALRSILRSDPDVVLVGEIRDSETAVIAIEAALTGHLVLSSLHTNDAAGTPMRLVEMGVEAFLVGSALDCVLAQRLTRQLCQKCQEDYSPTAEELKVIGFTEEDEPTTGKMQFRRAVGCQACSRTGYHGRIALQELLLVDEEIERAVIAHSSNEEIQHLALEQGMVPLRHDGLRKAAIGITSLEEILRVVV
ncbi:MAG: ATPase, T2SS/T4P/T4SS family [Acidimicrobiales bacterium]|jgi:type IV pilus assembly protein PilB